MSGRSTLTVSHSPAVRLGTSRRRIRTRPVPPAASDSLLARRIRRAAMLGPPLASRCSPSKIPYSNLPCLTVHPDTTDSHRQLPFFTHSAPPFLTVSVSPDCPPGPPSNTRRTCTPPVVSSPPPRRWPRAPAAAVCVASTPRRANSCRLAMPSRTSSSWRVRRVTASRSLRSSRATAASSSASPPPSPRPAPPPTSPATSTPPPSSPPAASSSSA
nr:hypothetical protein CFP56_19517 [Quercus suber]